MDFSHASLENVFIFVSHRRGGVATDLCSLIGRLRVSGRVGEGLVLISEVIMAHTSSVKGKAVSFANLNQSVDIRSLNPGYL